MEVKKEIFKRLPPGDRWVEIGLEDARVYTSLTEALEHYFQKVGARQYYIDAGAGLLYTIMEQPDPVIPIRQFSIYGDDY
jgi:hypothetical protein